MFAYNNFLHNRNNNNGTSYHVSDNYNDNTKGYVNVLLMLTTTTSCGLNIKLKKKNTSKNKGELENETQNKPQRQDDRRIRRRRSLDGKPRGQLNRYTERINETKPIPRGDTLPKFAFGFHLAPVIAPDIASTHTSRRIQNRSTTHQSLPSDVLWQCVGHVSGCHHQHHHQNHQAPSASRYWLFFVLFFLWEGRKS